MLCTNSLYDNSVLRKLITNKKKVTRGMLDCEQGWHIFSVANIHYIY